MHPTIMEMLADTYVEERLAEARRVGRMRLARRRRHPSRNRALRALGEFLIRLGTRLARNRTGLESGAAPCPR